MSTVITLFQIGETVISVKRPEEFPIPENMFLFRYEGEQQPSVNYRMTERILVPALLEEVYHSFEPTGVIPRKDCLILQKGDRECRFMFFEGAPLPYGVTIEYSEGEAEILVDPSVRELMVFDTIFLSLLGLEKQMLRQNALILHCAYMLRDGKAVLFSAPSGTGKSTQADLWEKYRGTQTINGDKSLLYRHEDGWYAHGWPICGSSEICRNETYPIEAIVMLHQAKENTIAPLRGMALMKTLMPQITINMWNPAFLMSAMDLIDALAAEVPVYELGCNISEDAVKCLEAVISK